MLSTDQPVALNVDVCPPVTSGDLAMSSNHSPSKYSRRPLESVSEESPLQYPEGYKLWLVTFALCLGGFLVSLDSTVVATAVPVITDEFNSINDIGWYSSVYFLTMCMPQLLLVKINNQYSVRWSYSIAMATFLAGSAVCGSAKSSSALIAGRALAGLGASGLLVGANSLVSYLAQPADRPFYFGLFAGSLGLGIGCGPLMGGAFTENVSWRWVFYINLPIGGLIYVLFFLFVHPPALNSTSDPPLPLWPDFIRYLDLPGVLTLTPCILCVQLALQWGGTTYSWGNATIIVLLVLFALLAIAFAANEIWQGKNAMLPGYIMADRNLACAIIFCFFSNGSSTVLTYYLPIWFQGVQGDTPIISGVHTLPLVITTVIVTIFGGAIMTKTGHVGPLMVLGSLFSSIGAGLLTTFTVRTSTGKWIGYQIINALGSAAGRLAPSVCMQNLLPAAKASYGYTLVTFVSFIAGAIFVSLAQSLFSDLLLESLQDLGLASSNSTTALAGGVNTITKDLPPSAQAAVLEALNSAITRAWYLPVVLCCLSMIGAVAIQHEKARTRKEEEKPVRS